MIQFVLGWRPSGGLDVAPAADALAGVVARGGFLDPARLRRWSSPGGHAALAYVAHDPAQLGGVEYVHSEEGRLALFAGRPVRWDAGGREADGAGPLDPTTYLEASIAWRGGLDGRWAAARYDDRARELEVGADALGAYPLFTAEAHGARWFSNAPAALAALTGVDRVDPLALAGLLGGGWSLSGDPLWAAVRRPRGGARRTAERRGRRVAARRRLRPRRCGRHPRRRPAGPGRLARPPEHRARDRRARLPAGPGRGAARRLPLRHDHRRRLRRARRRSRPRARSRRRGRARAARPGPARRHVHRPGARGGGRGAAVRRHRLPGGRRRLPARARQRPADAVAQR